MIYCNFFRWQEFSTIGTDILSTYLRFVAYKEIGTIIIIAIMMFIITGNIKLSCLGKHRIIFNQRIIVCL